MTIRIAPALPLLFLSAQLLAVSAAPAQEPPPAAVESEDLTDEPASPAAESTAEAAAAQAYAEGDLPRAISIYRELGTTLGDPLERARLRVTAAWLLFELGDRTAAADELRAALFQAPDYKLREDLYSAEFVALALDARAAAATDRRRAAPRLLQEGIESSRSGDRTRARRALEESLALEPRQPRAFQALASVDLAEGRTDEALAGFQRVLAMGRAAPELVPKEVEAQTLNNVGVIFFGRNQFEDAAEALDRSTALAPRDARAWFNLGLARVALADAPAGARALERAHELDRDDPEIALRLAQIYRDASNWIEGVALLVDSTNRHPEDPALFFELGLAQRGLGNRAGMLTSLTKAVELDPANRRGVALPAAMTRAEAELDAATAAAGTPAFPALAAGAAVAALRATEVAPEDAAAWAILGLARKTEGRLAEAALALERASTLAPQRADFAHNLATVYLAQKRLVEAEGAFRKALAIDPAFAESSAALARLEKARPVPPASGRATRPSPPARTLGADIAAVDYEPLGIRGLLVRSTTAGGLAERSGLLADDLVLRADGKALTQVQTLQAMVRDARTREIALSLLRAGKPVELQLRLD